MKTFLKIIPLIVIVLIAISCANGAEVPPITTVPTTPTIPTTGGSATLTFDFDTGSPALSAQQSSTPFEQTLAGVTAHFSSPADPAAFSIQNHDTTFFTLSQFSGSYLYQNNPSRTYLHIRFSQRITSITLTFATVDYHGVGEVDEPTAIKLTAYMDSTGASAMGSAMARGVFPEGYTYPQGTLSFDSGGNPFNLAVVELLYQPRGGTSFLIDNIEVTTANPP